MVTPRTCAAAYLEAIRRFVRRPWRRAEEWTRVPTAEGGRGVLVSELIGDEDGPEE